jgi:hypothetical protein
MTGYHVTTPKKLERYRKTGAILPPVRFWPNEYTARRWAKRTGRSVILEIDVEKSSPLPDHRSARWTDEVVRGWKKYLDTTERMG